MSVRERILTIRLMEKLQAYPELGKILGIEAVLTELPKASDKEEN